jgi:hypothetical protein
LRIRKMIRELSKTIMCNNASCTKRLSCARFLSVPRDFQDYMFWTEKECKHHISIYRSQDDR